jgi:glycosyltransferase involved in cell wall biosynthesis
MAMPASASAPAAQRIAFVCLGGTPLQQLRDLLLGEVLSLGHQVLVVAPELTAMQARSLTAMGVEHTRFAPEASGLKLFADWKAIGAVKQALADWSPNMVVACGGQTMVYGALAAKGAGVGRIVLVVDGLPEHRFAGELAADEMPAWRYGQALRNADEAVFHNRDDLALLKKMGVVPNALPVNIVPGAGVDLERHPALPLPSVGQGLVFLMIAGLDRRRGIMEYCAAAAALRQRSPSSRFMLAVLPEEGAKAIDIADLALRSDVEYLGLADAHCELIKEAHVFVYPAYAEGMPQPLLEAMAAGRPILTTDVPGCRETVDERVNGCLVAPRDADALAEAMESFLRRPDLIPAMARASRAKVERFATAAAVRRSMMDVLQVG